MSVEHRTWDEIARKLAELAGFDPQAEWDAGDPNEVFRELLEGYLSGARRVLQVGCSCPEPSGADSRVVVVDISQVALDGVRECEPVLADARKQPFHRGVFDLVYSQSGSLAADTDVLGEAARVLAPNGILIALAAGESHRIELQEAFGRGRNWPPGTPLRFAVPERLAGAGLELISLAEYYGTSYCPDLASYTAELEASSIIPGFNPERDATFVREVVRKLTTDRGIRDTQHRVLFVARHSLVWK